MDTEPPAPDAAAEPRQHDSFTVKERVAVGTAGVVYRAVQEATGWEVTFKVLTGQASHPLDTARVLALRPRLDALRHPVIAEFVDAYDDPEGFVIATSWLEGGVGGNDFPSKRRTLSPDEARFVAMELCSALLVGEQARFPHGDVKPSNVILADRGTAGLVIQLQDWGLSSCRDSQPAETLQFTAPECHHGHPASAQSDLFSAAATLSFLLTGHAPVEGTTKEECLKSWGAYDANALATERPDLDAHFRQWLGWLLRWQPGDRPKTVAQALDVLNQVITYAAATAATVQTKAPDAVSAPAQPPAPTARPAGPQSATARPAPKPPQAPAAAPTAPTPTASAPVEEGPKVNTAQRIMAAIMVGCVIGAVGVAFMMWAENKWGPDWKKELARRWQERKESPAMVATGTSTAPVPASPPAAKPASVTVTSNAPASKLASPAPPKAATRPGKGKAADKLATDNFAAYAVSSQLDGTNGGTGWQGPWKASAALISESPDKKTRHVRLGGPQVSTMRRELGTTVTAAGNSVCVTFVLWHPGEKGPAMLFDLLDAGDGKAPAPVTVQPSGDKVLISIQGSTEIIEIPASTTATLALHWEFKPRKNRGKPEVLVRAFLNPDKSKGAKATNNSKSSRRVLQDYSPPPKLAVSIRTTAPSGQPASIRDLRVARTVADALK